MSASCPHCGGATNFTVQDARLLRGTCPDCGVTSTVVQEVTGGQLPEAPEGTSPLSASPAPAAAGPTSPEGPPCPTCGTALVLRSWSAVSVEADCTSCGSTTRYRTLSGDRDFERPVEHGRRPRGSDVEEREPRGRPCRECGGTLRFSTDAAGVLTGECAQCGNRFTLPPRRDFDRRSGPPRDRGSGARDGYAPRGRRPGGWGSGGPPNRFRRGPPPRFRRRDDDSDEDEGSDRRRRRPRRE